MALIRVVNPNSNPAVTAGLDACVDAFRQPGRIEIACDTLAAGPFGIETDAHVAEVAAPLLAHMQANPADVQIIACYSDPGLALCRAHIDVPVFGIMESAIMTALARGGQFGVIALSEAAIARHLRAIRALGVSDRLAGERPIAMSVADSGGDHAFDQLALAGVRLIEEDDADTVILGCAGMAPHRNRLETALGKPVIDPVQAATGMALSTLLVSRADVKV